eukprot:8504009-Pyramimonas_sp.AAC.1
MRRATRVRMLTHNPDPVPHLLNKLLRACEPITLLDGHAAQAACKLDPDSGVKVPETAPLRNHATVNVRQRAMDFHFADGEP